MKQCTKCQQEKEISFFPKRAKSKDGYDMRCKKCHSECNQLYKEKRKPNKLKYEQENREYILSKKREYSKLHAGEKAIYDIEYRNKMKEKIAKYKKNWDKKMSRINPIYKIKKNMRRRLHHALKGNLKSDKTFNLVGCSVEFLKSYLQSKFQEGMSWENYGLWHIDHIKPCASFDLSDAEQQKVCFHYSNLQPLWAVDNLKKSKLYFA